MRLVVDTNILISAFLRDGLTRSLLLIDELELFIPEYVLKELFNHNSLLSKKTAMSETRVQEMMSVLLEHISILEESKTRDNHNLAYEIMKDIDKNDAPILAAALSIDCEGIWTDDKHFLKQDLVKVWRTQDLMHKD